MSIATRRQASGAPRLTARRPPLSSWLFNTPALGLLLVFLAIPFGMAVYLSFTNFRLGSPLPTRFIGLDNYAAILSDPEFIQAFGNNIFFAVVVVPLQSAIALGLAMLVNQKIRGIAFFRALFFSPLVIGGAVLATIWAILMDPTYGLLNALLKGLSFGTLQSKWLSDPSSAMGSIILICIWSSVGFQMVILLAALQDVPKELYEAAQLDGAGVWRQFVSVTLPGVRNTLVFVVTMTTIFAFRLFDQIYILTKGGPLGSTNTMLYEMVKVGYNLQQVARGCAIAVIFFISVVIFTLIQRRFVREEDQ